MSISSLFRDLGAPLRNTRWSWGSVHPESGTVFLRVWQDEVRKVSGREVVRLTNRERFEGTSSLGYAERRRHIDLLRQGAPGYLIFCEARTPITIPRRLRSYVSDRVFPTGNLCEIDGDIYTQFLIGIEVDKFSKH